MTIIANRPSFIVNYDEAELPKFNAGECKDMNVLMSQIVGCLMRGDTKSAGFINIAFEDRIAEMSKKGEHFERMANEYARRLPFYLENAQELGSKYIILWQSERSKAASGRR